MKTIITIIVTLLILSTASMAADDVGELIFSIAAGPANGELTRNSRYVYDDYSKIPDERPVERGLLMDLRLSYTLTSRVRVCLESSTWSRHLDDDPGIARLDYLLAGGGVEWLIKPFTARMILGLGASRVTYIERGVHKNKRDTGSGYLFALGWEKHIGKHLFLSPQLVYFGHMGRDTDIWVNTFGLMLSLGFSPGEQE